jgi:hypothetical protein
MDCLIKEAIKIWLNMNDFNRDGGFTLSKALDCGNLHADKKQGQTA